MEKLVNKIDGVIFVHVHGANPNGDVDCNRPRQDNLGFGEITDVCIKRKIRNRLQDMGLPIFVQTQDRSDDGATSLSDRFRASGLGDIKDRDDKIAKACEKYLDIRAFGSLFAFKGETASVGIRGAVTIGFGKSVNIPDIDSVSITKSVNGENSDGNKKSSDTIGSKYLVRDALYAIPFAIHSENGLTTKDADNIIEAMRTMFVNDYSSARPEGTMEVVKIILGEHNSKLGQYSSAKFIRSISARVVEGVLTPNGIEDYDIQVSPLERLKYRTIEGF